MTSVYACGTIDSSRQLCRGYVLIPINHYYFQMPSIHICDADEEESFRTSLQAKVNQAAANIASNASETVLSSGGGSTCQSPTPSDVHKSMAFQEYIFGDGHKATAPCGDLCAESDVTLRRHSHQPVSLSRLDVDSCGQLAKSVTLSDMTDPQTTHVMMISLESPSSVSSISEVDDSCSRRTSTSSGAHMSSAHIAEVRCKIINNNNRLSEAKSEKQKDHQNEKASRPLNFNENNGLNSEELVDRTQRCTDGSKALARNISRRRSEPAKQLDLSRVVQIDLSDEQQTEQKSQSADPMATLENDDTSGSCATSHSKAVSPKSAEEKAGRKTSPVDSGNSVDHGNSPRESGHRGNSIQGGNDSSDTGSCYQSRFSPGNCGSRTMHNEPCLVAPSNERAAPRQGRSRDATSGGGRLNESLTETELKQIKENGRLVIYFRGRPRSMSPSLRLHPLTVPQGSRSLRNSPFSSPQLSQKLRTLQGTGEPSEKQKTFFRHVRLKKRDLLE